MQTSSLTAALVGGALLSTLAGAAFSPASQVQAQDSDSGGLVKVLPRGGDGAQDDDGVAAQERPPFEQLAWRKRLVDHDLEAREASFEALIDEARRSSQAREALELWAEDEYDLELAWTARLALRELERSASMAQEAPSRQSPFGLWPAQPFAQRGFQLEMQTMQDRLRQLERDLDRWLGSELFDGALPKPFGSWRGMPFDIEEYTGQSFSLESGPDGVRVEVQVEENGETKTQTYEAESLEALLEAHPELRDRIRMGRSAPPDVDGLPVPELPRFFRGGQEGGVRTDVLGVMMQEPVAGQAQAEGLEEGLGLKVERAMPGTIAAALGLETGDVLVELNGRALRSGNDVREALAARERGGAVKLTLITADGKRETRTWKP